ncbi:MAG TPA: o-succinylbenzoate synthase [Acidimicrobiia bacterium]|nr:o-succinylbenzoate synthase [Acidimicrobiia bacterium]
MITIIRLVLREIALSLREPFRTSSGITHHRRILVVEAADADGAVGWGECVAEEAPAYSAETVDTARSAITAWVAPAVLGRPFAGPEAVFPALEKAFRGHPMAKAAVEMAAWDLAAQKAGSPLAGLLGGTRERVETGISLGIQKTTQALARLAAAAVAEGYRRVKVKVAPGEDVALAAAARQAVGEAFPLALDANAAYSLADLPVLQRLDAVAPAMIEQPLAADDLSGHARLQEVLQAPICLDESVTSAARAADMIALGAGRIINIKPGRVGGHSAARAIHDLARRHGVPVWCGGMLESGIGRAHNVALASLPNFILPGDLSPSRRYWKRDVVNPEWVMAGGCLIVPLDRPGIGVEVDREFLESMTTWRVELRPGGAVG